MMKMIRYGVNLLVLSGMLFSLMGCTPITGLPSIIDCGPGYTYVQSESACLPDGNVCSPSCTVDQRCVKQDDKFVCVSRITVDPNQKTQCAVTCGNNEICQGGQCIPAPCDPPCQAGFTCSYGVCTPTSVCNPPCQQTGYVCVNGLCEPICAKPCINGTVCIRGFCQKPCTPDCQTGFFCDDSKCKKLEDADGDGYRSDRDCNDQDKTINPGAIEVCNGKDDDCDGHIDNIVSTECYEGPANTLGVGPCKSGRTSCEAGKLICKSIVAGDQTKPADKEVCKNQIDDDCNGQIDDGCP